MVFCEERTSSIIEFINSILRANKLNEYQLLVDEAINELIIRMPLMAILYK